jgi:hypothetical protein
MLTAIFNCVRHRIGLPETNIQRGQQEKNNGDQHLSRIARPKSFNPKKNIIVNMTITKYSSIFVFTSTWTVSKTRYQNAIFSLDFFSGRDEVWVSRRRFAKTFFPMKFFIDTANLLQIKEAQNLGILDGVTTNPSLMAKEGISGEKNILSHYKQICEIVDGPISAEVLSTDFEGMIREGEALAAIHKNIVVKVPMIKRRFESHQVVCG